MICMASCSRAWLRHVASSTAGDLTTTTAGPIVHWITRPQPRVRPALFFFSFGYAAASKTQPSYLAPILSLRLAQETGQGPPGEFGAKHDRRSDRTGYRGFVTLVTFSGGKTHQEFRYPFVNEESTRCICLYVQKLCLPTTTLPVGWKPLAGTVSSDLSCRVWEVTISRCSSVWFTRMDTN